MPDKHGRFKGISVPRLPWQEDEPAPEEPRTWVDGSGQTVFNVHSPDDCVGRHCPIHNPSPEASAIGYTHWRNDRGIIERICRHGVGHPDPDQLMPEGDDGTHGCDGCCGPRRSVETT